MRVLKNSLRTANLVSHGKKGLFDWLTTVKLDDFRVLSATSKDLSCMLSKYKSCKLEARGTRLEGSRLEALGPGGWGVLRYKFIGGCAPQ